MNGFARARTPLLMLVRLTGVINIVSGILFWAGLAGSFTAVHVVLGVILVVSLWGLTAIALVETDSAWVPVAAALVGVALFLVGIGQTGILTGGAHWVVQAVHLVLGLCAIGLAEVLSGRRRAGGPAAG